MIMLLILLWDSGQQDAPRYLLDKYISKLHEPIKTYTAECALEHKTSKPMIIIWKKHFSNLETLHANPH